MTFRSLHKMTRELVAVAMGKKPADKIIKNGNLVNVNTAEILEGIDVAIYDGRIAIVGDASDSIGPDTKIIDASGYYICPGFLDAHIHVESSMLTVRNFAKAVLPLGTTGIFMDPHEIANVLGLKGVQMMHEEGADIPLKVFLTVPSCVPAASDFEDAGSSMEIEDISKAFSWDNVPALGEMMNYPGVFKGDPKVHNKLAMALKEKKIITGHFAAQTSGKELQAYVAAGCSSCHESTEKKEALAKMRLGMYTMIREGSAWHDVKETIKSITETKIDSRFCLLVSDDTHPETLLTKGHLNHVVRRAIQEGLNPLQAIQMVTINVAQYFQKTQDLGSISPGKYADILLIKDLTELIIDKVFINGKLIANAGTLQINIPDYPYPPEFSNTVRLSAPLAPENFIIKIPPYLRSQSPHKEKVLVRVIEVKEAKVNTNSVEIELPVKNGRVESTVSKNIAKIACIERHRATGLKSLGFVKGFALTNGAVASTVAHDSHNMLIIGINDTDMAIAANILAREGGGMVVVREGETLALLPLPLAGLMSKEPVHEVRNKVAALALAWKALGCSLESPFMTMALLSLPVIPNLRLTNRGLVDTNCFEFVDLFV